jgi:BMFP domain-containing protein YqiC
MDYLSELNIRCDFHPRGCREIVKLKNLERHVASCGFSPVQCSNDGCNALVSIRDKIYHQSEVCEFRKSKCHDCGQLKQEVKELRVQMMAQQDQMKEEMKETKDEVKNEVKKEIKEMTFQMLTRYDLLLAQQNQMKADVKGITEEVKNEVQQEMKALKVQMLSCQDQREMKSEIFARQDQMKEEIKEDMKGMQNEISFNMLINPSSGT